MLMNHKKPVALLVIVCFLLLSGCGIREKREPVQELQCTRPAALNSLYAADGAQVAVSWADYEAGSTTVQLVDAAQDAVRYERTMDGVWDLKEQRFSDGRLALCDRENNSWRFLSAKLEDLGSWSAENVDGFFSYDGSRYYCLKDHVLFCREVGGGTDVKVELPMELRLLELTAFDAPGGTLVMQFFLSPYSSECGTAIYDTERGTFTMLQRDRYWVSFRADGMCLLSFDNEKMGYSALYGGAETFSFADAGIFQDTGGDLYAIGGSHYLMKVAAGRSALYALDDQIAVCSLPECGIDGEMYSACYLPEEELVVGAVYQNGAFHLYVMDPSQLAFRALADAAETASPLAVDDTLAQSYWNAVAGAPVAESLRETRQYADTLEETYGVRILLSSQCSEAVALCDRTITLTDTMAPDEELNGICAMLDAIGRSLSLYPEGFPAQFRSGAGDGGLCFLLVDHIDGDIAIAGVTYESLGWQYIALDIRQTYGLDGIVCHEIWHATENYILSYDYALFPTDAWDALNPEGFVYYEDAALQDPSQPWTLYNSSPEEIHFVDAYSCVNRQEDRARIMEYFMTRDDEAGILIQSPFIHQKLRIMCDAVRSAFDTARWDSVRWERLL